MDYPAPSIPLSPILSGASLQLSGLNRPESCANSILANRYLLYVSSGRAAIALALEKSGITSGDEVLIPAFHCESMISPTEWRGASPVFYKINMDTTVDIEDIRRNISGKTRAIIVTHYFGFIHDMPPLVELCKQEGLILIEDCAHAFFGKRNGNTVGSWGDYAIASSMKFFPVYDGGILSSNSHELDSIKVIRPSLPFQIKSALNVVQIAIAYKRFGFPGRVFKRITAIAEGAWALIKKVSGREQVGIYGPASSGGGYGLDEKWIHTRASWFSNLVIKHQRKDRIARARRENYVRLHEALGDLPHSRRLFDSLPEGVVPLIFPLYVENPDLYFDTLKRTGVPIWRFGEFLDKAITRELCQNSITLSEHIFQFPCHQELSVFELEWMIEKIKVTFNAPQTERA